jgi:putative nucleotidyltransferase with HDIG domain
MKQAPTIIAIHDKDELAKDILRQFSTGQRPQTVRLSRAGSSKISVANLLVADVDLEDAATVAMLKEDVLACAPGQQQIIVVATASQQRALADSAPFERVRFLTRPLDAGRFTETVNYLLAKSKNWQAPESDTRVERLALLAPEHREALSAGDEALSLVFAFARGEEPLQPATVQKHGATIIESLAGGDLSRWITAVRAHHDGTYQHCMLVTGVAIAFAQILRIPKADLERLAFAALIHDIGKANVPVSILDKPGPLTDSEMKIMHEHPVTGANLIASSPGVEKIVVDVVRHHHEYLDGTGYPDGLRGEQIPDLVRITTIADIFGALVEKRSYKAPMSGLAAYDILVKMGPKLDQPLVRVMRAIARDF